MVDDNSPRSEQTWASDILNEWRAAHTTLLDAFETGLRQRLDGIDPSALVARRLKRTPSIIAKLKRMTTLPLANMQDIGGVRVVVSNMSIVQAIDREYRVPATALALANDRDYIANPKDSGYRSIHLVYRNGPPPPGDGTFQFEFQIRTRLQHAWATAVETVDAFRRYSLKSGDGPPEWLEYFILVGAAFAFYEGCNPHPHFAALGRAETFHQTVHATRQLLVRERLRTYTAVMQDVSPGWDPDAYYLLELDPGQRRTTYTAYTTDNLAEANARYTAAEFRARDGESIQVALVAAGTVDALKQAYPNYFMDTQEFVKILDLIAADRAAS